MKNVKSVAIDSQGARSEVRGDGSISLDDPDRIMEDIGFAEGVLGLLCGSLSAPCLDLSSGVIYVVSEAQTRLKGVLDTICEKTGEV